MASFRSRHNIFLSFYIYYSYVSVSGKAKHIRESRNTSSLESGTFDRYFNPIRPGERGGGGRKVPALISTFENFLAIQAIPTKFCHFF